MAHSNGGDPVQGLRRRYKGRSIGGYYAERLPSTPITEIHSGSELFEEGTIVKLYAVSGFNEERTGHCFICVVDDDAMMPSWLFRFQSFASSKTLSRK